MNMIVVCCYSFHSRRLLDVMQSSKILIYPHFPFNIIHLIFSLFPSLFNPHSFSMKISFASNDATNEGRTSSTNNMRISTQNADENDNDFDAASMVSKGSAGSGGDHTAVSISSPTYWQSPQGKKVMKSLPPAAPPLDLRKIVWDEDNEMYNNNNSNSNKQYRQGGNHDLELSNDEFDDYDNNPQLQGRMVSTAHPAVGSALQAARRSNNNNNNNNNRAMTAPE